MEVYHGFSPHAPRFKCPLFFRGFPFARRQNPARQPYSARRLRTAAPALFFCLLLALSPVSGGCQAEARPENAGGIRQAYEAFQSGDPSLDRFGELAHTVFMEEAVSDTLTLHYRLAAPEDFGVAGHTPTLGDFSAEALLGASKGDPPRSASRRHAADLRYPVGLADALRTAWRLLLLSGTLKAYRRPAGTAAGSAGRVSFPFCAGYRGLSGALRGRAAVFRTDPGV